MRKKIVAGNWKMNMLMESAGELAEAVCNEIMANESLKIGHRKEVVFFPPFLFLHKVAGICEEVKGVYAGAQNCHQEDKGAYTGEIAVSMIKSVGASYVLIGHSERRSYYHEDDQLLAQKVKKTLEGGLLPMFCCGELLPEREADNHFFVVRRQLENGLFWLTKEDFKQVVIAYEPVWAIGTGVTASPEQAQEMHAFIRSLVLEKYDAETAESVSILYGGSCNAQNAQELFSNPDVDGGLIGGASLKAHDFMQIISAM
jgi:triosephosphate isomerase (TIM)